MIPADFPHELDGAIVLYIAIPKREDFGCDYDSSDIPVQKLISFYALARYHDDNAVYQFDVSDDYHVIGDLLYQSIDEAMERITSYGIKIAEWIPWQKNDCI